jgi:Spy/CpxP family protein refolding chaperone
VFIVLVALASGLVGGLATRALGQGLGYYGHWHGGGPGFRYGWMDPAAIDQRIERGVKHLAIEIDATKEQQYRLIAIAKSAVKDLLPLREKMQAARTQGIDLFAQPTVDRAAVEKLRSEQMASAEEASRRLAKAIADAAEVLTPEQRRTIADRIPPPGAWRRPWHRG